MKDLGSFRSLGQPSIKIAIDRVACARYGVNTGDVDAIIQAAIGGQALTQVYEGERHFGLTVRWVEEYRNSVDAIRHIAVPTPDGSSVPLGQIAKITKEEGPSIIYREDGKRYTPVKFSVRGRDLASTVEDAQSRIASKVQLPYDTHLEWAGQLNELKDAVGRLAILVPVTLLLIGLLVYSAVKNWVDTLLVLLSIPLACTGGVAALLLTVINFSVSAPHEQRDANVQFAREALPQAGTTPGRASLSRQPLGLPNAGSQVLEHDSAVRPFWRSGPHEEVVG